MGKLSERVKLGMAWLGLAAVAITPVAYTAYKSSEHERAEQAKQANVASVVQNPEPVMPDISVEPIMPESAEPIAKQAISPFEACIDGLRTIDGLEFAKKNCWEVKSAIEILNANFCKVSPENVPSESCPVNKGYLLDLESTVNLINKYAPVGIEVNVMHTEFTDYSPNFNTSINGELIVSSRLLEKIDAMAAAFAYKTEHEDFDIITHFKKMQRNSYSRDPIKMPPGEYDMQLSNNVRKAIIAYVTAHEAGHVMHKHAEREECGENLHIYFAEEKADAFAAEFISAAPEIASKAAPLLFWIYDGVNGIDNADCKNNNNAYARNKHPCSFKRYESLRNILNREGIDTSQIDSIFALLK